MVTPCGTVAKLR